MDTETILMVRMPDAFPSNPDEWQDTDGDFVGNNEDAFPFDPSKPPILMVMDSGIIRWVMEQIGSQETHLSGWTLTEMATVTINLGHFQMPSSPIQHNGQM